MSDTPTNADFGDFTDDDAFDTAEADPEQVAIKLNRLRRERGLDVDDWEELTDQQRQVRIEVVDRLLTWLRRQGGLR